MSESVRPSFSEYFIPGILALVAAVPIAWGMNYLNKSFDGSPETSVFVIGILSGLNLLFPALALLVRIIFPAPYSAPERDREPHPAHADGVHIQINSITLK